MGSDAGIVTESAPSSSPWWTTGTVVPSAGVAPSGNVAAGLTSLATFSQTVATSAPVPLASTPAIRSKTSSAAYASPTRPEKSARTSYGVARLP